MPCKINLFFEAVDEGWSETYYYNSSDVAATLTALEGDAVPGGQGLANWLLARRNILPNRVKMTNVRVTDETNLRNSQQFFFAPGKGLGNYPSATDEPIYTALLIRYYTAGPKIKNKALYLGGIPASQADADGNYNPSGIFPNRLGVFNLIMSAGQFLIKARPDPLVQVPQAITGFTPDNVARSVQVFPNLLGQVANAVGFCVIRGVKNPRGWNGVHRCYTYSDPITPLVYDMRIGPTRKSGVTNPLWTPIQGGTVQLYVPQYLPITDWDTEKLVERKRGRPFGKPRGRRS